MKRALWFVEIFFPGINFGSDPGIGLDWVFKPSLNLTCTLP